jgi:hypothetical protein
MAITIILIVLVLCLLAQAGNWPGIGPAMPVVLWVLVVALVVVLCLALVPNHPLTNLP